MFGLSPVELMVVGVVAILLFGSKLPDVARSLGGSYRELRKGLNEFQDQVRVADFNKPPEKPQVAEPEEEEHYAETTAPKFVPPASRASAAAISENSSTEAHG
ncbi:Sec-independent protein translocase subunit TatA/TatB [Candidatus Laterigemmans baculatus]|uniref:Sec-independent protein translocase subunit TatA/TatB n=1 Tax=Candidatus Laterigemmans baculatus TaxID=2770505 RepID=UPI0013D8F2E0|nr:twin-arginine translocase TatA/TatE family subunit [Candidatus Laterigemmans baculatus]